LTIFSILSESRRIARWKRLLDSLVDDRFTRRVATMGEDDTCQRSEAAGDKRSRGGHRKAASPPARGEQERAWNKQAQQL
jgi:hypothetical protein